MAEVICSDCGRAVPDILTTCPACGALARPSERVPTATPLGSDEYVSRTVPCSFCRRQVADVLTMCPHCGSLVYGADRLPMAGRRRGKGGAKPPRAQQVRGTRLVGAAVAVLGVLFVLTLSAAGDAPLFARARLVAWLFAVGGVVAFALGSVAKRT